LQILGGRIAIGENRMRGHVDSFHSGEMPAKMFDAILDAEYGLVVFPSGGRPELFEMSFPIGNCDQPPSGTKYSRHFRQSLVEWRNVIEHPGGDHGIERIVLEWYFANVRHDRFNAERT
jgi:hypothetical protein